MGAGSHVGLAEAPADLLVPAAQRVGLLFAGGLAVVVVVRGRIRNLAGKSLFLQWRTWLVAAPVYVLSAVISRWTALAFVTALAIQGLREYADLAGLPRRYRTATTVTAIVGLLMATVARGRWPALLPALTLAPTLVAIADQDIEAGVRHIGSAIFGLALIAWPLATFLLIRDGIEGGRGLLLAIGAGVALGDVSAFVVGSLFGHHRLAARVSPAKTWEGVAGGLLGAFAGVGLMWFALPAWLPVWARWALPAVIAAGSVWGDLTESMLKRARGVKDAGGLLPGFGGVMDRIDSLLVALPLCYVALVVLR